MTVFGQALEGVRGLHGVRVNQLLSITPDIAAQSVPACAIFLGIAVNWLRAWPG